MQVATHPGILLVFFYWEKSRKCRNCWKPNQLGIVPGIGHQRPWKKLRPFQGCWKTICPQTNLLTLLEQSLLNMNFCGHPWNDPNFCMQMGMPMLGIHAKLEPLSTVYVSCHTFDHLSPFFEGFQETTCSQTELSGLPRHRTLNMIFFGHSWNDSNFCQPVGIAHHRHSWYVWRKKVFKIIIWIGI